VLHGRSDVEAREPDTGRESSTLTQQYSTEYIVGNANGGGNQEGHERPAADK
jgi:hypothetical protein